jgi:hypothetical protein
MTRHKWADVLIAIAEGREVECKGVQGIEWELMKDANPISNSYLLWRVKPVPVIRYEWLLLNKSPEYAKSDSYIIYSGHVPPATWDIKITYEDDRAIKVESK